jgi:hypothetical protein
MLAIFALAGFLFIPGFLSRDIWDAQLRAPTDAVDDQHVNLAPRERQRNFTRISWVGPANALSDRAGPTRSPGGTIGGYAIPHKQPEKSGFGIFPSRVRVAALAIYRKSRFPETALQADKS